MVTRVVSVVLGSYNRIQFLPLTIESIRKELADIAHEIIVVDGGSDDGALQWLIQQKDIITIIQHNRGTWHEKPIERRSWGYFMNLGFKIAQGSYVCMLSDDCLVVPGAIKNGIKHFDALREKGRNVGALAFYWRDYGQENFHIGYTLGEKLYVNHGMFLNTALRDVNYIDEETFFFYNGDGDLCLKLWHRGYEVLESPHSYIEHYQHANPAIRKTNYARFNHDLKNYLAKWERIFYDKKLNNLGKIIEKNHGDHHNTADGYRAMHQEIIKQNPKLAKPRPLYMRLIKRFKWTMKAIKTKLCKLL